MRALPNLGLQRLLQKIVARARSESTRCEQLLTALRGRTLAIEVLGTPLSFVVNCDGESLTISAAVDAAARIVGAPLSLLALNGPHAQAVLQRGDARIEGDVEIAQQYQELARLLRADLEQLLGEFIGRTPAHLAARALRGALAWSRDAAWTQVLNVSEYLAHESADLVSRAEAEHFLRGVEQLREQLDRAEARLAHLEQRARHPDPAAGRR